MIKSPLLILKITHVHGQSVMTFLIKLGSLAILFSSSKSPVHTHAIYMSFRFSKLLYTLLP